MSGTIRLPSSAEIEAAGTELERGLIFWADTDLNSFQEALEELTESFQLSKQTAIAEESFVFVVGNDDLLGRNGPIPAMIAAGLLSAARTAALEGWRKGWTCNVVAYDASTGPELVLARAAQVMADGAITGELIHVGPGHIGKALA